MIDFSYGIISMTKSMRQMKRDENAQLLYSVLADGLYWSDEALFPEDQTQDELFRYLLRYRMSLILGRPEKRLEAIWTKAKEVFPDWIGFIPERTQFSPSLIKRYEEENKKAFDDILGFR